MARLHGDDRFCKRVQAAERGYGLVAALAADQGRHLPVGAQPAQFGDQAIHCARAMRAVDQHRHRAAADQFEPAGPGDAAEPAADGRGGERRAQIDEAFRRRDGDGGVFALRQAAQRQVDPVLAMAAAPVQLLMGFLQGRCPRWRGRW